MFIMDNYSFTVIFEPDITGGYNVVVPALPGCFTQGDTLEEAQENAKDAIKCHLGGMMQDRYSPPPTLSHEFISRVDLPYAQINKTPQGKFAYA